jgi:serine/threonine-protein kinase HipA
MSRSLRPDTLSIKLNNTIVGTLTRLIDETLVLAFDPAYEEDPQRPTLSLSFKTPSGDLFIGRTRTSTRLSPFFSNLLPEGHLRNFLASKLGINTQREFFLLAGLGQDLPGAVIVEPVGELSEVGKEYPPSEQTNSPTLRFSLAGVQLKFSAIAESKGTFTVPADGAGGSWVIKLPSKSHLQVPETEFSMLTLARMIGITVPEFKLVPTSTIEGLPSEFRSSVADSLAVKRFDRTDDGSRVHMEDFAQVYSVYPQNKYEKAGYAHIARVLWTEDGEASYTEFIRRLVFTVAIGNGDMHLKNWSLLYLDARKPILSPAYDFVPSIAYIEKDTLALNLGGTKHFYEVTIEKFKKMAAQAKAPERLTEVVASETIERIWEIWKAQRFDLRLSSKVRQDVDKHLSKLPLFRQPISTSGIEFIDDNKRQWIKNIVIADVDYEPIVSDDTMILEAPTGNTTAVRAPNRMEPELILKAAQQASLLELAEGPARAFVGEKLYRQWRQIQFISIDTLARITIKKDLSSWRGNIQTLTAKYSPHAWQKIVSAYQRKSYEIFDISQRDGSIRTFNGRILDISAIQRESGEDYTMASVEIDIQDERIILNPCEGISYLSSSFDLRELQNAVEETLREKRWETGLFSEPKRFVARNTLTIELDGKSTQVPLEAEIVFQQDTRKTDLLIKVTDLERKLGKNVNLQARQLRQDILEFLPGPD